MFEELVYLHAVLYSVQYFWNDQYFDLDLLHLNIACFNIFRML